jgi:thiosulfate/3-mercaptopyruvate sulfurtransferase
MPTTIVSTGELAGHLDGSWVIVDCRYDLQDESWGRGRYLEGHVPGAVYASLSADLAGSPTGHNGRHPLPDPDAMAATFGRLGIGPATQVVAYDQGSCLFASRLWWMLRYMGHDAVAVLDGGWARWVQEGRDTRPGDERRPAARFDGQPRSAFVTTLEDVMARLAGRRALLVDARSPERFAGQVEPIDRAAGHIPGARNHHHQQNTAPDGTMLPPEVLRARFEQVLGGRPPSEAIMYCGSGVSACHNLVAMAHAGLPGATLYPGSWSEWSADPGRPVETGPVERRPTSTPADGAS